MKNSLKKFTLPFLLAGTLIGVNAYADPDDKYAHFYLGATYGQTDVNGDDFDDDKDNSTSFFAGYDFGLRVGVELAYVDLGGAENQFYSTDAESIDLSAVGNVIDTEHVDFYIRGGLSFWNADVRSDIGSLDNDGTEFFWGVGTELYLTREFALRLEYTRYEVEVDDDEGNILTNGEEFNLNRLNLGVKLNF